MTTEAEKRAGDEAFEIAATKTEFIPDGWYPYQDILVYGSECFLAGQQSQWIPVGERLPDEMELFWACNQCVFSTITPAQIRDGKAFDSYGDQVIFTHWMPIILPETKESA